MQYIMQNENSNYHFIIDSIIRNRKSEVFSFFDHEEVDLPFNVYIYDSISDLVDGLKKRGFPDSPDYMCACFKDKDQSMNFFEPKDSTIDQEWSKEEYEKVIFHELIHGIQFLLFGTLPEWLSEGIAKYLDGTYSKGISWLLEHYIHAIPIPKQSEIENEFGKHSYDSYDYAYLMVHYLIDTLGKDGFIELLKNKDQIDICKQDLLAKSVDYYDKKYETSKSNTKDAIK